MEVWNGIWKKILVWNGTWNGRFLVRNGNQIEKNRRYGIWNNHLPFHTIPCILVKMAKLKLTCLKIFVKLFYAN